ncbi:Gpi inositol-deacylase [Madurella fahalii]|uniref:Gpi inositol-deacylase n=1 Tax=Madurella fahalii TaxID=1157608 RepID=A0ABQ0FZR0_9PEZI
MPSFHARALDEPPPPCTLDTSPVDRAPGFKSSPGLPTFDLPSFDLASEIDKAFNFASVADTEELSLRPATARERTTSPESERENETAPIASRTEKHTRNRSKSMIDRPLSWLPSSKPSPNDRTIQDHRPKRLVKQNVTAVPDDALAGSPLERSRAVESFADFAKRSWISKSRSPSPPTQAGQLRGAHRASSVERPAATPKARPAPENQAGSDATGIVDPPNSKRGALTRASVYLTRLKQKPQSVFSRSPAAPALKPSPVKSTTLSDPDCATPTLHSRVAAGPHNTPGSGASGNNASCNSLSSQSSSQRTSSVDTELDTDTTTASTASENTSQSTMETSMTMPHPTSRDPLWATFRTLDTEFARLAARNSTAARMGVVRAILIPFLRSTAYHPSNSNRSILTSEDVDRRATILNKWWIGLLAMLVGGSSRLPAGLAPGIASLGLHFPILQPVAGVDRPTLLEATTMIMMRPEWRACTSYFQPLADRRPGEKVRARSGTASSVDSEADELLAESAEHNIRTMFVTNLTTQMALVVEKLSMRHSPLSLVNWCGKACAYAFFFAPGIADVLVRLWGLNADLLRRVADEFGLPRRSKGESEDIVALFPPHLHKLGWSSVKGLADKLRLAAKLPLMLAKIHWHGPWVSRWRGGDTDLLFIFCKYFYILAEEFMPEGLPLVEKARAPAFVLVHAQLLYVLDSTIHRQASLDAMLGPPLSDALHGADAALTAQPQLPNNLLRGMDENRLVVLLKDMLAENSVGVGPEIKHAFAEAFIAVAKAATKRTPRFEHAACFMLCDFLEEALVTLDAFQNTVNESSVASPTEEMSRSQFFELASPSKPADYIDWPFWFEVGKMIMDSNNTMSEIRIMSFIFSVWDAITADPARKEALCLEWLLSEEIFAKFFNHWCPMVRAYYMRLLCWRVCRDSGSANEVDIKIFLAASQRLKTVWSHYLWLRQEAEAKGRMLPSTAPCYPTPGKRFLIIRTEVQPPQQMRLGFDSFSSSFTSSDPSPDFRGAFANVDNGADGKGDGNMVSFKKRLSLLGKVLPFAASQEAATSATKRTWEEELEQARRDTAASRMAGRSSQPNNFQPPGPPTPPKQGPSHSASLSTDSVSSTGSAPLFDAGTFVFRFALTWQTGPGGSPMHCGPQRDRVLTRPRLPAPAQARVSARSAGLNGGGGGNVRGTSVFRSDSPPPISPGLPPVTRRVSGLMQTGLISEARNARPLSAVDDPRKSEVGIGKPLDRRLSLSVNVNVTPISLFDDDDNGGQRDEDRSGTQSPVRVSGFTGYESDRGRPFELGGEPGPGRPLQGPAIRAERPTGVYASGAVYAGRALAEWGMVVGECNSFVDRRRDEGVLGLRDVEVPTLSVEGLGLRQRG